MVKRGEFGRACVWGETSQYLPFNFVFIFFNYVNALLLKQFKNKVVKHTYLKKDWYSKYMKLLKTQH